MVDFFESCTLCPRKCRVNRHITHGFCGTGDKIKLCRASLHHWEEPCISGTNGSGTVFFSGCQLRCIFCQNSDIALSLAGLEISENRLCEIFFELADEGAHNINLVTPSHFTPIILSAIDKAKRAGFSLPFVWNSSAYEEESTIELLRGKIDIFLPDFKYFSSSLAKRLSDAPDYFEKATSAVKKMFTLVGKPTFDENNLMRSGMIVRHLVLPSHTDDSIKILEHLYSLFGDDIFISIMNQYTPMPRAEKVPELTRRLTTYEYNKVVSFASEIGIKNGFVQGRQSAQESFIPAFDYSGVLKKQNHSV